MQKLNQRIRNIKKQKKSEKSDNATSEDDAAVNKSKKDKGKDTPGETGANVKAQNITISAQQFQEMLEMIK